MKKLILTIVAGLAMAITTTTYAEDKISTDPPIANAQEKALKDFNKKAGSSVNPNLYTVDNGFILQLPSKDVNVRSAYNDKGNWVYTISRYTPANFSKKVVETVKDSYAGYNISSIEKIEQPGKNLVYVVSINNDKTIKTLRVSNNEVELIKNYQKA